MSANLSGFENNRRVNLFCDGVIEEYQDFLFSFDYRSVGIFYHFEIIFIVNVCGEASASLSCGEDFFIVVCSDYTVDVIFSAKVDVDFCSSDAVIIAICKVNFDCRVFMEVDCGCDFCSFCKSFHFQSLFQSWAVPFV